MKNINIVFMGTPSFAVPILQSLIEEYNVVLVVSQPDKEKNRKGNFIYSPCKKLAIENEIEVYQPKKIREEYQKILDINPDIIITAAYGQIIPEEILNCPKYGCINVHGSLLPKLRGGAPIHHAIINGDDKTGVTIMYMDKKMDAGDIIAKREVPIDENIILDELYDKVSYVGRDLLIETLPSILNGTNDRIKQNEEEVTFGYNITKEEEKINWNEESIKVHNRIRGLSNNPGAYTTLNDKRVKVYLSEKTNLKSMHNPGTIENITKEGLYVNCKDYQIKITCLQMEGKKKTMINEFVNGIKKETLIGGYFE